MQYFSPIPQSDKKPGLKLIFMLLNPLLILWSQERKTAKLNEILNELSDYTLVQYMDAFVWLVGLKRKRQCVKYHSANEQYKSIAKQYPRLAPYQSRLLMHIKKARRKAGLKK